jgi:HEAT repeat protein
MRSDFVLPAAEPVVYLALVLGLVVSALSLVALVATVVLRMLALRVARLDERAQKVWSRVLADASSSTELPRLRQGHVRGFIGVWNEVHEPLKGETTPRLASIAKTLDLESRFLKLVNSTVTHHRIIAVIALGHVKTDGAFAGVSRLLEDNSPILSLCAARSLMQINAARAVPLILPLIANRAVWTSGVVASILVEAEPGTVEEPLADATLHANGALALRLIRFLADVSPAAAAPFIRAGLETSADPQFICACLQLVKEPEDADRVRPLLGHALWFVRMHAASAIGRIGRAEDVDLLLGLLSDAQWWVRYRAAQSVVHLNAFDGGRVQSIKVRQTDPFARDILDQVLAERSLRAAA